jgi:tetratricopeptide (TPR) repeat protein
MPKGGKGHMSLRRLFAVISFILSVSLGVDAQSPAADNALIVLSVEGRLDQQQIGWTRAVPVQPGSIIPADTVIFPQNAELIVLCPDFRIHLFTPAELLPNQRLTCPGGEVNPILEIDGVRRINRIRSSTQNSDIPYILQPRASLVRGDTLYVRWNAPLDVQRYQLTILGMGGIALGPLTLQPAEVAAEADAAAIRLPVLLQPDVPYTIEICALFADLRRDCTSDPGVSEGREIAFFSLAGDVPVGNSSLRDLEASLNAQLNPSSPELLYAHAVLLSQRIQGDLGLNHEAIDLLLHLISAYPDSPLVRAPAVHQFLGDLYIDIGLRQPALRAYQRAAQYSMDCTDTATSALLSLGLLMEDARSAQQTLDSALEEAHCLLTIDAFTAYYAEVCRQSGDRCDRLRPLSSF